MAKLHLIAAGTALLVIAGCGNKKQPAENDAATDKAAAVASAPQTPAVSVPPAFAIPEDTQVTAFGKGRFERADGKTATFKFDSNFHRGGKVSGMLEYSVFEDGGKLDVTGTITCGHHDLDQKRVWIGGTIDANRSTLEAYQGDRYRTGQPLWIRFEESDSHPNPPAKISELRFAGDDNVADADTFCSNKSWVAGGGGLHPISADGAVIIFPLPETSANQ